VPGQENIMLSSQPAYEQMKAVYEAQQQVPEKSFLDMINPFSSASAAEMPPVPNVSLGTPKIILILELQVHLMLYQI
jgi:hypothetical protein